MNILVTGGAGYIGGTFAYEALKNNHNVLALDNFSNSKPEQINKLKSKFFCCRFLNFLINKFDVGPSTP